MISKKLAIGILYLLAIELLSVNAMAQHTINFNDNTLEIGGVVSVYYNQRYLKSGETDLKKNSFSLRNLRLGIEGHEGNNWEYKFNVDMGVIASNSVAAGVVDPEAPGLVDAWVACNKLPVYIKFGYDKVPYSLASLNDVFMTPFWSRGLLTDGSMFSRRDIGLTLSKSMWKQKINIYGGVYSGLGENLLAVGSNDASGNMEYIGRVDVAYPSRYKYMEIDEVGVPIPIIRLGVNARYADKTQPTGAIISTALVDDYHLRFVNGEKTVMGFDASFEYKHFSAQFEAHQIIMKPANTSDVLFSGTSAEVNNGIVKASGFLIQGNYCSLPLHSVVSVKYENVNLNDLIYGNEEWLSVAYAYQMKGFKNVLKVQYYYPIKEDIKSDPLKWTSQIRVGWQYIF